MFFYIYLPSLEMSQRKLSFVNTGKYRSRKFKSMKATDNNKMID